MKILRQVGDIDLNQGDLMAQGLYNLYNNETNQVSIWFDEDVKNAMLKLPEDVFLEVARVHFEYADNLV
jgi:hypothetical protein